MPPCQATRGKKQKVSGTIRIASGASNRPDKGKGPVSRPLLFIRRFQWLRMDHYRYCMVNVIDVFAVPGVMAPVR